MTRYLISLNDGDMTFPEEDLPDVSDASHACRRHREMSAGPAASGATDLVV